MSKYRRAARIDENQSAIVNALRDIPGLSVALEHDDILVGYKGKTFWYEIKKEDGLLKKDGTFRKGKVKQGQYNLAKE